jgi:hypothetical protein
MRRPVRCRVRSDGAHRRALAVLGDGRMGRRSVRHCATGKRYVAGHRGCSDRLRGRELLVLPVCRATARGHSERWASRDRQARQGCHRRPAPNGVISDTRRGYRSSRRTGAMTALGFEACAVCVDDPQAAVLTSVARSNQCLRSTYRKTMRIDEAVVPPTWSPTMTSAPVAPLIARSVDSRIQ